jgi:RNA polymerase sigma factor (sigma-70 family)
MPKPPTSGAGTLARLSDRALFSRAAQDEAAFGEIVHRYREPLRRHAARYVGDADAEDVVQQALVNASLALRREPARDIEPKPWLYKVTTNAAIDHRRALSVRPLHDRPHEEVDLDAMAGSQSSDPHEVLTGRESVRSMVSGIRELAPNQRRAATARFLEGRSHDEIASELGVSKGAARELIHRAKRNLRETIPALSPLPFLGRLRDAIGGLFAGSGSAGAAKLAAGAVVVVAAAGVGGVAISQSRDGDGGPTPAASTAEAARPTAALPSVATVADRPAAGGGSADSSRGGNGDGGGQGGSGSGSQGGSAATPDAASGQPSTSTPAASSPGTSGSQGGSNPVQGLSDQLGVDQVADQVGQATEQVESGVNGVGDQLGVDVPDVDVPNAGELLGGGN